MFNLRIFVAAFLLGATPALAQPADDLASKIVNDPGAPEVNGAKAKLRDDAKVQGGKALRIAVPGKGENAWTVALQSPIKKPVKAGDQLVLAFWSRLEKGENGATSTTLPYNAVQMSASPWSALFTGAVQVGPEWKLHEIRGKADKDYPAGSLNVAIHLATARQTLDFGPIVVLDLGPSK